MSLQVRTIIYLKSNNSPALINFPGPHIANRVESSIWKRTPWIAFTEDQRVSQTESNTWAVKMANKYEPNKKVFAETRAETFALCGRVVVFCLSWQKFGFIVRQRSSIIETIEPAHCTRKVLALGLFESCVRHACLLSDYLWNTGTRLEVRKRSF